MVKMEKMFMKSDVSAEINFVGNKVIDFVCFFV